MTRQRWFCLGISLSFLLAILLWQHSPSRLSAPADRVTKVLNEDLPQSAKHAKASVVSPPTSVPSSPAEKARLAQPGIEPIAAFNTWLISYQKADIEQRTTLEKQGIALAEARRPVLKSLIADDPRSALAAAVPMVIRQQLPASIVAKLERRINHRAGVTVYQGAPASALTGIPGEATQPMKSLTHRIAQIANEGAYNLHVFGRRAVSVLNVPNAALNGIAIDRDIAVFEDPGRLLEVGEVPDPAKKAVTVCPVSGKTTLDPAAASKPISADQQDSVISTPEENIYLCGPYHATYIQAQLIEGEGSTSGPTQLTGVLPAPPTPAIGMLRVLYIPMTFQDQNDRMPTESKSYEIMRNVADYYSKSSFGKLTTLTTVTPPVKLVKDEAWYVQRDTSNGGDIDGLGMEMAHAREEARRIGFDYQDYDVTVLRLIGGPRSTGGWGGGGNVWVYGDSVGVTAHEIGHTFGLAHANFWDTAGTSAIGPGANAEYGDSYDVMGGGGVPTDHYNAAAKVQIKWLPSSYVLNVTSSGLYRIYAFDQPVLDPRNRYALTITKDSQRTYWGELRQNYTGSTSRPWADQGMILGWKYPNGSGSNIQLIDTTPGSPYSKDDAAIALGSTFADTEAGIYITTVGVSSTTPKYVDVLVNIGDFSSNHAPTLALSASANIVPTGTTVTFTATASDADNDTLAYQWQHWGDTAIKLVSPNSPSITRTFSSAGNYVVSCTVSDMKGGSVTRTTLITVGNGNSRYTISGRVTDSGVGLAGVLLNANGTNSVVTDSDGYYTIANLAANTYSVTPLLFGYTFGELFNNSVTVGPNFTDANFEAAKLVSVSLVATDNTATENTGATDTATFRLTRTGDVAVDLVVSINPAIGTAATSDYTLNPLLATGTGGFSTFTIPADSSSLDVVVTTTNDAVAEGPETLTFALAAGAGYLIAPNAGSATAVIEDDDTALPKVSVIATNDNADEAGTTPGVFTFSRTGSTGSALTINYAVSGNATAGTDYSAIANSIVIPVGSASATVNIVPQQDTLVEPLELVTIAISSNAAYVVNASANTATVNLFDDDTNVVNVVATDATAQEIDLSVPGASADTGTFLVTRTGDTTSALTVYYSIAGSPSTGVPALNGVDFDALAGVVQIPAGQASASISIVPRWDGFGETPEQVLLQLGAGPTDYKLGASTTATVTINDAPSNAPYVEIIGLTTAIEGSTAGKIRFSVKGSGTGNISVPFSLSGTATRAVDYTVAMPASPVGSSFDAGTGNGILVISANGTNTLDITLNTINDTQVEDQESIVCTLTPDAAFTSFGPTASASIWLREDDAPTVWVDSQVGTASATINRITEGATTSPFKFYVSRTGATTAALTVNFSLSGTATAGTDYLVTTGGTGLVTFNNATSTGTVTIPAAAAGVDLPLSLTGTNDTVPEGTESIIFHAETGSYSRTLDATIYLDDNDTNTQTVSFETTGASGSESVSSVSIPVSLAADATVPTTVDYIVDTGTRASTVVANALANYPYWTRVVRAGSSFSSYYSTDGNTWMPFGSSQTISMSSAAYTVGLIAASASTTATCTATIDSVSITGLDTGGTASASATYVNLGTQAPTPAASSDTGGVFTLIAGGNDLAQSSTGGDVGKYASFGITNSANCIVTARVVGVTGGSATLARGGVEIRETTSATSKHMAATGQRNGTVRAIYRLTTTAASVTATLLRPYWVKLNRTGSAVSAWSSADGATWTQTGTTQTLAMSPDVLVGLAVSAKSDGLLSTAVLDNVSLNSQPATGLVGRTVGYVNAQGSDALSAGAFTVIGSGAQIGGTEDECHFVAAPTTGDFTLIARVVSQSGGGTSVQAGVMMRERYDYRGRSAYVGIVANAMSEFIYRASTVTNAFGLGIDYTLPSGTLTFAIGDRTKYINLGITNDTIPESNEAISVMLRYPNAAQLGTNSLFTYVIDDDDAPSALPFVGFAQVTGSAVEATAGTQQLAVTLSAVSSTAVSVDYAVTGGTATSDADFTLAAGTLIFAPGQTVQSIALTLLDDSLLDAAETIVLTLTNPVNAVLSTNSSHTFTIIDDDLPVVSIVANDASAAETAANPGQFTISRTGPTTSALNVLVTRSGTAGNSTDYASISAAAAFTVTIPINAASSTVTINPVDDSTNEGNETVILTVNSDANYNLASVVAATVIIADNDRSTVSIVATDNVASETAGNTATFAISRTAPTTGALTVTFTASGTATSGSDYTALPANVAFLANETTKTVTVTPLEDAVIEGSETVLLQLTGTTYTIGGTGYDQISIVDNDFPPVVSITSPTANGALVATGQGIVVAATATDDGTPAALTYQWSMASGPGSATFESPTALTSAVSFSGEGVYVLRFIATDSQFTVSDQVTIIYGTAMAPTDWIAQDMGPTTQQRGQSAKIGNSYVLTGMGAGYAAVTTDGAHIMSRQVTGDGSIVARLTALSGPATAPLAGLTIRDSLYRSDKRVVLGYTAGALQFRTRGTVSTADTVVSQSGITLPVWLKLERVSNTSATEPNAIRAFYANDVSGAPGTWTQLGTATTLAMINDITPIGLTATGNSSTPGQLCSATLDNVVLTPTPVGPALVSEDFGTAPAVQATYAVNASTGAYTIAALGGMDGSGAFYGWQYNGDLMVTAKLLDANSGALSAKSGIMIRESMDNGAYIHLGHITSGSFNGYIWRGVAAGSGGGVPSFTGKVRWMRLIRQGNRVTAYHAADVSGSPGVWAQLGQPQTIIMSTNVLVGFAVDNSGGATGVLNTAQFNNLSIVPLNRAPVISPSVTTPTITTAYLNGHVSDDDYPLPVSLTTQWQQRSGPASLALANPSASVTSAPITVDGNYTLRLYADDSSIKSFANLSFTAYVSTFAEWQATNFSSGSSNASAAPTEDPDNDGLPNLLEYALGTGGNNGNPSNIVSAVMPVSGNNYLCLIIPKNSQATDVTYTVEATSDLANPLSWSSDGLVIIQNNANTLEVRDNVPMTGSNHRFMRLRVNQ